MTMRGEDQNHHHHHQRCELCTNAAAVYCPSDSAYLCFTCDARVHYANFLVARHVRAALCSYCFNFSGYQFSGHIQSQTRSICRSCIIPASVSAVHHSHESSISTATGASGNTNCDHRHRELPAVKLRGRGQRKNRDRKAGLTVGSDNGFFSGGLAVTGSSSGKELPTLCKLGETRGTEASPRFHEKAESVFKSWCRKLGGLALCGLDNSDDPEWSIAFLSRNALHIFRGMPPALPGRLSLAASFWLTMIRYCRLSSSCNKKRGSVSSSPSDFVTSSRASQDLCKRIEEISGVPANSIFAVGSRFYAAADVVSKKRRLAGPPGGGGVVNIIINGAGGDQEEGWGETDP